MKTPQKFFVLFLLASAVVAIAVTSCNTVRGVGRDVERTGDHIEHSAR